MFLNKAKPLRESLRNREKKNEFSNKKTRGNRSERKVEGFTLSFGILRFSTLVFQFRGRFGAPGSGKRRSKILAPQIDSKQCKTLRRKPEKSRKSAREKAPTKRERSAKSRSQNACPGLQKRSDSHFLSKICAFQGEILKRRP